MNHPVFYFIYSVAHIHTPNALIHNTKLRRSVFMKNKYIRITNEGVFGTKINQSQMRVSKVALLSILGKDSFIFQLWMCAFCTRDTIHFEHFPPNYKEIVSFTRKNSRIQSQRKSKFMYIRFSC